MNTLELKDLKVGKIYKRVENKGSKRSVYVQILTNNDSKTTCNLIHILPNINNELIIAEIKKDYDLSEAIIYNETFTLSTEKEFKKAVETIKNSLTF